MKMAHIRKGQLSLPAQWVKHLKKWGKRVFWHRERKAEKKDISKRVKE